MFLAFPFSLLFTLASTIYIFWPQPGLNHWVWLTTSWSRIPASPSEIGEQLGAFELTWFRVLWWRENKTEYISRPWCQCKAKDYFHIFNLKSCPINQTYFHANIYIHAESSPSVLKCKQPQKYIFIMCHIKNRGKYCKFRAVR